jgi:hypothetical protein
MIMPELSSHFKRLLFDLPRTLFAALLEASGVIVVVFALAVPTLALVEAVRDRPVRHLNAKPTSRHAEIAEHQIPETE